MIYFAIGFFLFSMAFFEIYVSNRIYSKSLLLLCFLMFLLVAALRVNVGPDWGSYYEFYTNKEEAARLEFGYELLNNFSSSIRLHYNFFIFLINILSLRFIYLFIINNSKFYFLPALLFFSDLFLYFNLSGIRQAIAISITCYSITYVINRDFYKFLFAIILASSFHSTALIFLSVYFIPVKPIDFKNLIIAFSLCIFILYFAEPISDLITLYGLKDTNYYINNQQASVGTDAYYVGAFRRAVIIFFLVVFRSQYFTKNENYLFANVYLVGFAIYMLTYNISPDIGVRLSSYFLIFEMLIVGRILTQVKSINKRIFILSIFTTISFYKIFGYINDESYIYNSIINIF